MHKTLKIHRDIKRRSMIICFVLWSSHFNFSPAANILFDNGGSVKVKFSESPLLCYLTHKLTFP